MSNLIYMPGQWMSKAQLATELGVHPRTINNMHKRGEVQRREDANGVQWRALQPQPQESKACNQDGLFIAGQDGVATLHGERATPHADATLERDQAQSERDALRVELAAAHATIDAQGHELVHLRHVNRVLSEQSRVSFWGLVKSAASKLSRFFGASPRA